MPHFANEYIIPKWLDRDNESSTSSTSSATEETEDHSTMQDTFSQLRSSIDVYRAKAATDAPQTRWPRCLCSRHRPRDVAVAGPATTTNAKPMPNTVAWFAAARVDPDVEDPPPYTTRGARLSSSSSQLRPVMRGYEAQRPVYKVPVLIIHSEKEPPAYRRDMAGGSKQASCPAIRDVLSIPACRSSDRGGVSCGFGWRELRELVEDVQNRHVVGLETSLDAQCEIRMLRVGVEGLEERVLTKRTGVRELGRVLGFGEGEEAPTVCLRVDWWFT